MQPYMGLVAAVCRAIYMYLVPRVIYVSYLYIRYIYTTQIIFIDIDIDREKDMDREKELVAAVCRVCSRHMYIYTTQIIYICLIYI